MSDTETHLHIFIAGSRALRDGLMEEISSALSPIYTFSYNVEFNSDTAKELENSVLSVVACNDKEEEEEQLGTKIGNSIESQYKNIDIVQWDPEDGASALRFILDTMMLRYVNMLRKSRGEPLLNLDPEYHNDSDNERYSHLISNVVHDENGSIDIEATNLKIKSYGFRITTYADGPARKMGYLFRPIEPEDENDEEKEKMRLETSEEPNKDQIIVDGVVCSFSECTL